MVAIVLFYLIALSSFPAQKLSMEWALAILYTRSLIEKDVTCPLNVPILLNKGYPFFSWTGENCLNQQSPDLS